MKFGNGESSGGNEGVQAYQYISSIDKSNVIELAAFFSLLCTLY